MGFLVESHDRTEVLNEGEGEQRQRATPGEAAGMIELLGGFAAKGAVSAAKHDAGLEDVSAERPAAVGDEGIALGQEQGDGGVEGAVAEDGGHGGGPAGGFRWWVGCGGMGIWG
jgi:hypothetical protein